MIKLLFKPVDLITGMVGGWRSWFFCRAPAVAQRQPGEFARAIQVPDGEVEGLSPKWKHGSGRWVRGIRRENHPRTTCRALAILIVKLLRCC
jgi:hypothetical protein